jgi:hypothetical protein
LEGLHPYVGPGGSVSPAPGSGNLATNFDWGRPATGAPFGLRGANWIPFRQINNSLGVIVFAFVGAILGRTFAARDGRSTV